MAARFWGEKSRKKSRGRFNYSVSKAKEGPNWPGTRKLGQEG